MPLHELSDALLYGQFGFKWYFGLWGLYGHIQWLGHTSLWGYTLLRDALVWFELYMIHLISYITNYIEHFYYIELFKFPLKDIAHVIYYFM